jgi:hypothetical protein
MAPSGTMTKAFVESLFFGWSRRGKAQRVGRFPADATANQRRQSKSNSFETQLPGYMLKYQ